MARPIMLFGSSEWRTPVIREPDPLLVWKMKVTAIYQVYQFGGRVTLIDHNDVQWIIERRPEAVLKQIKRTLATLRDCITA